MNNDILEFIERCKSPEFQKQVEKSYIESYQKRLSSISKWNDENREKLREFQKKYESTLKGKHARKKVIKQRYLNFKRACEDLDWEEKKTYKEFLS